MFPAEFDYERATSVPAALETLASHVEAGREVELLAGGHGLVPGLKARERTPDVVVDLDVDDLAGVSVREDELAAGALTTYADLAASSTARTHAPVLAEAAAEVGDVQVRNCGTLGGNLVEAHPAADPPAAVLAADATLVCQNPGGERTVPATEFFRGDGETAVRDEEIVTEVRVPTADGASGAYVRRTHPASGYALVGVAAVVEVDDGVVSDARIAATGALDRPVRLTPVEAALEGIEVGDASLDEEGEAGSEGGGSGDPGDADAVERAAAAAGADVADAEFRSDPYASGTFRRHVLETYVERAVREARV
jgi:carbon-monoxide dehydrogenase medium subunit